MTDAIPGALHDIIAPPPWMLIGHVIRACFMPPTGTKITTARDVRMTGVLVLRDGEPVVFLGKKNASNQK